MGASGSVPPANVASVLEDRLEQLHQIEDCDSPRSFAPGDPNPLLGNVGAGLKADPRIDYSGLRHIQDEAWPVTLHIWRVLGHLDVDNLAPHSGKGRTLLLHETDSAQESVRAMVERRIGRAPIVSGMEGDARVERELSRRREALEGEAWELEDQVRKHDSNGGCSACTNSDGTVREISCMVYMQAREGRQFVLSQLTKLLTDEDVDDISAGVAPSQTKAELEKRIVLGTAELDGVIADAMLRHKFSDDASAFSTGGTSPGGARTRGRSLSGCGPELTNTLSTLIEVQKGETSSLLRMSRSVMAPEPGLISFPPVRPPFSALRRGGEQYSRTMGSDAELSDIIKTLRTNKVDEVYVWENYERTTLTANSPLTLSNLSLRVIIDMMRRSEIPGICDLEHFTGLETLKSRGICLRPSICVDLVAQTSTVLRTMRLRKLDQVAVVDTGNVLCGTLHMRDLIAFSAATQLQEGPGVDHGAVVGAGQESSLNNFLYTVLAKGGASRSSSTGLGIETHGAATSGEFMLSPSAKGVEDEEDNMLIRSMLAQNAAYSCRVTDSLRKILKQFKKGNLSTLYVVNDTSVLLGHIHIDDVLMPFLNATVELLPRSTKGATYRPV